MQKIVFTVKEIHKYCYKQSCSFWLRYRGPDPTQGAYSAHPDPHRITVFRGLLLREEKEGKGRGGRKGKRGDGGRREGRARRNGEIPPPPPH